MGRKSPLVAERFAFELAKNPEVSLSTVLNRKIIFSKLEGLFTILPPRLLKLNSVAIYKRRNRDLFSILGLLHS